MATDAPELCPSCQSPRPANAPAGLCPRCLLRDGLASDALSLSRGGDVGATIDLTGPPSVLEALAAAVGPVPRVLLRDTDTGAEPPVHRPASPEMPAPSDRSARLHLLGEIARGGMGAVLKGRDEDLGRDLAVKVLLEQHRDNPELIRRFVEEAQIGGQLQHPGIVPIYELGSFADRRPYFAMKLVKGRTLAALLAGRPSPSDGLPRFLGIFEQVCQTMAYAHARGVIHRDLKPSNIMVGSFGEVQVMDWGLAKVLPRGGASDDASAGKAPDQETVIATARSGSEDSDLSRPGSIMGTPSYMAPEQARGETDRVDERADVFALGSILCEILTGEPAYRGQTHLEILDRAKIADLADARSRLDASGRDPDLITIAMSCLAPVAGDRPHDASEVARRTTAYLTGVQDRLRAAEIARAEADARAEAEEAKAEAERRRAESERARRRTAMALAAAVLVAGAIGGGSFLAFRLDRQRRQAGDDLVVAGALAHAEAAKAEAERSGGAEFWDRALVAADKAKESLPARSARPELSKQVESLHAAVASRTSQVRAEAERAAMVHRLAEDLDEARLEGAAVKDDHFDSDAKIVAYARAFRRARLNPIHEAPKVIVATLGRGRDSERIAAALDDLATSAGDHRDRDNLARIARSIDPDRNPLRDAIGRGDRSELVALAEAESSRDLPGAGVELLAKALVNAGRQADAIRLLIESQRRSPGDFWINQDLGMLLNEATSPRREEAVRFLTVALALRPDSPGVLVNLGNALRDQGKGREAEAACRAAVRLKADYVGAHTSLGAALGEQGKASEAEAAYREAIRLKADDFVAYIGLGNTLLVQGNASGAAAACREAIRLKPEIAEAHLALGNALTDLGKTGEAEAAYREAIKLRPRFAKAHYNLGTLLHQMGRVGEAEVTYREAIHVDPGLAEVHANLAMCLVDLGRAVEAEAACRAAIRLKPELVEAHIGLGSALSRQGKEGEAEAAYREAVRLKADRTTAHVNLGTALRKQGKVGEAATAYREAIRLEPGLAEAHAGLGNALFDQGQADKAEAAYREAIRLKPEDANAYYNLGISLGRQDKAGEAIVAYREATRLKPGFAEAHCFLGYTLRSLAQYKEALAEVRKGHELGSHQRGWGIPSTRWVRECEILVAIEARIPALLRGTDSTTNNLERLALSQLCDDTKRFATSARFWADALADDPKLGDDPIVARRYHAAVSAALAGLGQGDDDPKPNDATRAKLRERARNWLRIELVARNELAMTDDPTNKSLVAHMLSVWKTDTSLVGVRDAEALARLPEDERKAWQALWADVDALLAKVKP